MDSRDLNSKQLDAMSQVVARELGYLNAVLKRMDARGFPTHDELRELVTAARDAMHTLRISLHYRACDRAKRERDGEGHASG